MNKKIYFVRHGECECNTKPIRQVTDSPLTEKGREQAKQVAERLSRLDFDALVSSTYPRAKQTAEIIAQVKDREIIETDLLIERVLPNELVGQPTALESTKESHKKDMEAFVNGEKYKEGESFEEITSRAREALDFIDKIEGDTVVAVTHANFLRIIASVVLLRESNNPKTAFNMLHFLSISNTGITYIEKNDWGDWKLHVWNDSEGII